MRERWSERMKYKMLKIRQWKTTRKTGTKLIQKERKALKRKIEKESV